MPSTSITSQSYSVTWQQRVSYLCHTVLYGVKWQQKVSYSATWCKKTAKRIISLSYSKMTGKVSYLCHTVSHVAKWQQTVSDLCHAVSHGVIWCTMTAKGIISLSNSVTWCTMTATNIISLSDRQTAKSTISHGVKRKQKVSYLCYTVSYVCICHMVLHDSKKYHVSVIKCHMV